MRHDEYSSACGGCTRREFDGRQREAISEIGWRAAEIQRAWWHPLRARRLRQEVRRIHAEAERDYTEHMTRDSEDRLRFRCQAHQSHSVE